MKVNELKLFDLCDVYFCYDLESVMFRSQLSTRQVYMKFYHEPEKPLQSPLNSRIYTDSLLYGEVISKDQYERGFL